MAKLKRWNWKGDQVRDLVKARTGDFLTLLSLAIEGNAKGELYPGHGVETGTLRRSIHAANPRYNWPSDNVEPSESTPERGGGSPSPGEKTGQLVIMVGSGMSYAARIEDLYHYLQRAYEYAKGKQMDRLWEISGR